MTPEKPTSTQKPRDTRPLVEKAESVLRKLVRAGHEAYFAGGCVRDMAMNIAPKDYDIATSATPDEVVGLFERTLAIGAQFGVIQVRYGGEGFEVATFRTETGYSDGRRPDTVEYSSAEEDVKRRDFTVNGLLYDPRKEEVIDHVDGMDDIANRIIRAIGDPHRRIEEDRLRMLRGARFAARLDFEIEAETMAAISQRASTISTVSQERIRDELLRILSEGGAPRGVALLGETGLLSHVLPEAETDPVPTGTVESIQKDAPGDAIAILAALLHACSSAEIEALAKRLRLSNAESSRLDAIIRGCRQLDAIDFDDAPSYKRFLRRDHTADALRVAAALPDSDPSRIDRCIADLDNASDDDLFPPPLLNGNDLKELGYPPGPLFKSVLERLEDAQLRGEATTREQAEERVAQWMAESPD